MRFSFRKIDPLLIIIPLAGFLVLAFFLYSRLGTEELRLEFKGEPVLTARYSGRHGFAGVAEERGAEGRTFVRAEVQRYLAWLCWDTAASRLVSFRVYDGANLQDYLWRHRVSDSYETRTLNGSEFIAFQRTYSPAPNSSIEQYLIAFREPSTLIEIVYPIRTPYCLSQADLRDAQFIIATLKLEGRYR